jgi:hypothetical protein
MHFGGSEFPPLYIETARIIYANEQMMADEREKYRRNTNESL